MSAKIRNVARAAAVSVGVAIAVATAACGEARSEGFDPQTLPVDVRGDYAVFAQRCSKCHALARPLNSGIDSDDYWTAYVAKMRRQPESGISPDDGRVILRFLHYFSIQERAKKADARAKTAPPDTGAASGPSADGGAGTGANGTDTRDGGS